MVTYDELIELAKKSGSNFEVSEEDLIAFVKGGAIRAYKAGDDSRAGEDVACDFNAETKELRLSVRKTIVSEVKDKQKECTEAEGKAAIGETAMLPVSDPETYKAIDAAVAGMRRVVESGWKKKNTELVKTKFQEFKEHCMPATILKSKLNPILVSVGGIEALLPEDEQIADENLEEGSEIIVYVKELREGAEGSDMIVSRRHPALVSHAMRRHIPEVDLGTVEIKAVARIPGKRSRAAVFSKDLGATERCENRASKVSQELGGELVEFVESYPDMKAFIVSSLKVEARDVHLIESEKQALVEVFKESANWALDADGDVLKLAQELTGYKIEIKLVAKDASSDLPGV